jgi:hypothetical protein
MRALVDTEERIAYSREFYNRTVRKYNTIIKQFPFSIISFFLKIERNGFPFSWPGLKMKFSKIKENFQNDLIGHVREKLFLVVRDSVGFYLSKWIDNICTLCTQRVLFYLIEKKLPLLIFPAFKKNL